MPDDDFGYTLRDIFGDQAHAFRKYQRIMYWMPKFRNNNPYPVPFDLPEDPIKLAVLALKRMAVDLENKLSIHMVSDYFFIKTLYSLAFSYQVSILV